MTVQVLEERKDLKGLAGESCCKFHICVCPSVFLK